MKTVFSNSCKISDYKPISIIGNDYYICWGKTIIKKPAEKILKNGRFVKSDIMVDSDKCFYDYMIFTGVKPTKKMIKTEIEEYIDSYTSKKITTGFVYNGEKINLSKENQLNYKAAFDLAMQTNGMNLPYKIKTKSNGTSEYIIFSTIDEFYDFYLKMNAYIQKCLEEGWERKDSIDYSVYEI